MELEELGEPGWLNLDGALEHRDCPADVPDGREPAWIDAYED